MKNRMKKFVFQCKSIGNMTAKEFADYALKWKEFKSVVEYYDEAIELALHMLSQGLQEFEKRRK